MSGLGDGAPRVLNFSGESPAPLNGGFPLLLFFHSIGIFFPAPLRYGAIMIMSQRGSLASIDQDEVIPEMRGLLQCR